MIGFNGVYVIRTVRLLTKYIANFLRSQLANGRASVERKPNPRLNIKLMSAAVGSCCNVCCCCIPPICAKPLPDECDDFVTIIDVDGGCICIAFSALVVFDIFANCDIWAFDVKSVCIVNDCEMDICCTFDDIFGFIKWVVVCCDACCCICWCWFCWPSCCCCWRDGLATGDVTSACSWETEIVLFGFWCFFFLFDLIWSCFFFLGPILW